VRYLLNAPLLTSYGRYSFHGPLSVERAREIAAEGFTSAVGHQATAERISELLGLPVGMNRQAVRMAPGEEALVFRLFSRLPEGVLLSLEALRATPHEFGLLRCYPA
jgi:Domain of unknown function (DUF1874)